MSVQHPREQTSLGENKKKFENKPSFEQMLLLKVNFLFSLCLLEKDVSGH